DIQIQYANRALSNKSATGTRWPIYGELAVQCRTYYFRRKPIGNDSPNICDCSAVSSATTSSTIRGQDSGTGSVRSTAGTADRRLSSTSSARWPLRRASCARQNAQSRASLSWLGSKPTSASSQLPTVSGCTTALSGPYNSTRAPSRVSDQNT